MPLMTLYGAIQWEPELLSNIRIPGGTNREALIRCILDKCGDLYPYFQDPTALKRSVSLYFERMYPQFLRIWDVLQLDYDPISNYDRKEETSEHVDAIGKNSSNTDTELRGSQISKDTSSKSVYNASDYQPTDRLDGEGTTQSISNAAGSGSFDNDTNRNYKSRVSGNVGVTTSQQMVESELTLREYDFYTYIAHMFENEFMFQIY